MTAWSCSSATTLQRANLEGLAGLFSVSIDHHETFTESAAVNYVVPTAAATAELIYRFAQAAGVRITADIATCLYTAVLTDTGSFCYSCTNAETFAFAREMVLAGADPASPSRSRSTSPILPPRCTCLAAHSPTSQCQGAISWMHVSEADMLASGATEQDCEGLVNWALSIHGVEATAFFREIAGSRYRVSLRSKGRIDVSRIAQTFGGGGHACASGHDITGPLEAAANRVLAALRHALELSSVEPDRKS